ncbi:hypothetical protein DYQ48_20905 [Xanthomonas hortorum]|nr:hypothetical protein DYQ48_20905 [Xanthomonas hortorum]QNM63404.1 hypothetical protein XHV734_4713 [Xanthomonas hortorum pv. vitians]
MPASRRLSGGVGQFGRLSLAVGVAVAEQDATVPGGARPCRANALHHCLQAGFLASTAGVSAIARVAWT